MKTYLKRLWRAVKGQDHEMQDLGEFNRRYGLLDFQNEPAHLSLRLQAERFWYLLEEAKEFRDATTLELMADALIDIVYIAKGTARMMGLPWEELWADVQRANMEKKLAMTARSTRDVVKPPGWVPPRGHQILEDSGASYAGIAIDELSPFAHADFRDYPEFKMGYPVKHLNQEWPSGN